VNAVIELLCTIVERVLFASYQALPSSQVLYRWRYKWRIQRANRINNNLDYSKICRSLDFRATLLTWMGGRKKGDAMIGEVKTFAPSK
jgi:hypothetical protein